MLSRRFPALEMSSSVPRCHVYTHSIKNFSFNSFLKLGKVLTSRRLNLWSAPAPVETEYEACNCIRPPLLRFSASPPRNQSVHSRAPKWWADFICFIHSSFGWGLNCDSIFLFARVLKRLGHPFPSNAVDTPTTRRICYSLCITLRKFWLRIRGWLVLLWPFSSAKTPVVV